MGSLKADAPEGREDGLRFVRGQWGERLRMALMCSVFAHISTSSLLSRLLGKGDKRGWRQVDHKGMDDCQTWCPTGPCPPVAGMVSVQQRFSGGETEVYTVLGRGAMIKNEVGS